MKLCVPNRFAKVIICSKLHVYYILAISLAQPHKYKKISGIMVLFLYPPHDQVFPGTLLQDPDNTGRLFGRSEVERRTDYIQPLREQLGEQHPLLQLVCQCLHNTPALRPSAEELLQQLEAVRPQPQIKGTRCRQQVKVEMAKLQVAMMSLLEAEVGEDGEVECLRHDLHQVQVRVAPIAFCVNIHLQLCVILDTGSSGG